MKLSSRVEGISESLTLALNSKAVKLADEGKQIYNLTAGQLPFRPMTEFINLIRTESDFLKSYQYSPVPGFPELRKKVMQHLEKSRNISFEGSGVEFDCIVGDGAKHSVSSVLAALIDPGDEVIIMAPYWVSYPEMIKLYGGVTKVIETTPFDVFVPSIDDIKAAITDKTKAIIINSPNNPAGLHYSDEWMDEFGALLKEYPNISIISDEIYFELFYFDPKPTYFYQKHPELLKQTVIIEGISKTLASTGLRIGYAVGPKELISSISKLQGQTTSGANSLIQRALVNFDFDLIEQYLEPIKIHLRENAETLRDLFKESKLAHSWYQPLSAFYYLIDFSQTPVMSKYKKNEEDLNDYSMEIGEDLLTEHGIAVVPGKAFGVPNTARMSLVLEKDPFRQASEKLMKFMTNA